MSIDGGKDLAMVLIKETDNKSIEEIAAQIRNKGKKIQKNKGDQNHQKRK